MEVCQPSCESRTLHSDNFEELSKRIWSLTAAAPSDSVFRALCINSLTYLLIYLHRKSLRGFLSVPKLVTLNNVERRNGRYFALFH